jgi:hypothetical protein
LDMAADTPLTKNSIANFSRAPVAESFEYISDSQLIKISYHLYKSNIFG